VTSSINPANHDKPSRKSQREGLKKKRTQKKAATLNFKAKEPIAFRPHEEWPSDSTGFIPDHLTGLVLPGDGSVLKQESSLSISRVWSSLAMRNVWTQELSRTIYTVSSSEVRKCPTNRSAAFNLASQAVSTVALKRRSVSSKWSKLVLEENGLHATAKGLDDLFTNATT